MDRQAAWKLLRRLGRRAGIEVPIGRHTLRHAYITRGHELDVPLADLQDAAGHAHPSTTRGYDRRPFNPDRHPSFLIAADLAT
jgi:integrase